MSLVATGRDKLVERLGTGLLAVLLLTGLLVADREDWPSLVGDEATYLMAAESLAWDFDLLYERVDYDRFVAYRGIVPEGLILASGDLGERLVFSKPFFYPLYLAPFVRLAPVRGPLLANFVALALAAGLATRVLRRRVGPAAALWVAIFLFASPVFNYLYWAHADLFLLALAAVALALVFGDRDGEPARTSSLRWLVAGVLLAAVAFSRPMYAPLALAPLLCAPRPARPRVVAFALGGLLVVLASLATHRVLLESWTSYDAQRAAFYERTGFAEVEIPRQEWLNFIYRYGDRAWTPAAIESGRSADPKLLFWNAYYFTSGRHVGVLVYFLPLVLGLAAARADRTSFVLLAAVAVALLGFFYLRPFNFYGGGASVANRYFLPLYPVFWFLATRPLRARWLAAVTAVAALFMWPMWADPSGFLFRPDGTYRFVSPIADSLLPLEASQSHLKPSGQRDVAFGPLWVRPVDPAIRNGDDGHFLLAPGRRARLLLAAKGPLREIELAVLDRGEIELASGSEIVSRRHEGDRRVFRLRLGRAKASHPMWWTTEPLDLHVVAIELAGGGASPVPFTLARVPG